MSHRTGQAQTGFPHDFINQMNHQRFGHHREGRLLFGGSDVKQQAVRQHLGTEGGDGDITSRQKNGEQKSKIFQQPDKGAIVRAVGVVVHALKMLFKQVGHHQCKGRAIHQNPDSTLVDFRTQGIRSLGGTYR